ncbi:MAG: MATE family efflux transporter [Oscillospiraceae bacterium]|jgi:putative MATE family efflux protein|nr:MATE family efflux transporter [Oscillospiraceae bacterium]
MNASLTEGKVSRLLIRFSLPFLLSSLIQTAYSSVDIFFLGRFAAPESLAGAANGAPLIATVASLFMGLASGGMILLGQFYGGKREEESARTTGNTILLQFVIAILSMTLIFLLGKTFIRLMDVPVRVEGAALGADEEAWNYMRICIVGIIFNTGYGTISSILRALGNSKTPLIFVAISCLMNIVLDYIFVGPLELGASGAAIATVISQICSFGISLVYILRKKLPYRFALRHIRPDWELLGRILKLGIPISLQTVLNVFSFLVIGRIINGMGLFAAAANGIVNNLVNFYMIIPMSIGSALSAISAQNFGAGKPERAIYSAKLGILFSLIIAVPCTIFASLHPTPIVSLLSTDPDVIRASAEFLIPFSWDCLFVSFVFCVNGFFNGCGITSFVAVHETVAAFAVRIPLSWALGRIPGATLFHIGIGTPAATLASLVMCVIYYKVKLAGGKLARLRGAGAAPEIDAGA